MKTMKETLIRERAIRASVYLLFLLLSSYLLFLCDQIPLIEKEVEKTNEDQVSVELKAPNPYKKTNFFTFRDLSTTEYILNYPYNPEKIQFVSISESFPTPVAEEYGITTSYSNVKGGDAIDLSGELVVHPHSDKIHFYTNNVVAENTQMIRNFFLTELILFLLALLGKEAYKMLSDIFSDKTYFRERVFGVKSAQMHMMTYLALSLLSGILLYCINIVPENMVTTNNYEQKSGGSWLALHDISCAYQHLLIPASSCNDGKVNWESGEIVKFVPETFKPIDCEIGPKSISFTKFEKGKDVDIKFYTRYLQSSNYQDVRLFVLTTFLLFFLERSFFYLRKWIRNKKLVKYYS